MAAAVGDSVIFQNRPATVIKTRMAAGQQWDTLLFDVPQVAEVLDSAVQTVPPPPPPPPPAGSGPAGPAAPGQPARPAGK